MNATLTVFTPTYNRAHTLHKCYESLLRQTCSDFVWLIVDDGSDDSTRELVKSWLELDTLPIRYYYQKNQGMHGGHNSAYRLATTELCMCVDSDDYLADNAVEEIVEKWVQAGSEKYAGMVCHNSFSSGEIVGKPLPDEMIDTKFKNVYYNYRHDKKYVYRREVFNKYPDYPIFPGEKLTPLSCKYFMIDEDYLLLVVNKVVCIVEYMEDGSTKNIFNHYRLNPNGIKYVKNLEMVVGLGFFHRMKASTHYVAANIRLKKWGLIRDARSKILTCAALVPGAILYLYINCTKRRNSGVLPVE